MEDAERAIHNFGVFSRWTREELMNYIITISSLTRVYLENKTIVELRGLALQLLS